MVKDLTQLEIDRVVDIGHLTISSIYSSHVIVAAVLDLRLPRWYIVAAR